MCEVIVFAGIQPISQSAFGYAPPSRPRSWIVRAVARPSMLSDEEVLLVGNVSSFASSKATVVASQLSMPSSQGRARPSITDVFPPQHPGSGVGSMDGP